MSIAEFDRLMERRNVFVMAMAEIESVLRSYRYIGEGAARSQEERDCCAVLAAMDKAFAADAALAAMEAK